MRFLIIGLSTLISLNSTCQTTNYNDVVVIVNSNSQASIDIGNHFQVSRSIPLQHIIQVDAPVSELIDNDQFLLVKSQIENYLLSTNLVDSINYIVTTKGVPLKINSGCVVDSISGAECASFDSEIALILGNYASSIGQSGSLANPYFNGSSHFSRNEFGFYLVTRLDGYTKSDVISLIDRSGPETAINKNQAKAIVDISNSVGGDSAFFTAQFTPVSTYFETNSWNTILDLNTPSLLNQNNVFGYFGIGHGPLPFQEMNYEWTAGSIAVMEMCSSSYTLDHDLKNPNDLLLGDLIAEGCTGGSGNVDYIFFSQIMNPETLVIRLFDTTQHFNLAECFYMAGKTLSWQTVVIGDPKSSIRIDNLADLNVVANEKISIYPNPTYGNIIVNSGEIIRSITLFDCSGAIIERFSEIESTSIQLDFASLKSGIYTIQINTDNSVSTERLVKVE